jgi:thioredoxin reductase
VYDTVIVGGGPAGLSAALILARCRRSVLVCDAGAPRNARARALHGFISRDGVRPLDLLRIGREELRRYDIEPRQIEVTAIRRGAGGFDVTLGDDSHVEALTVLLASGITDELPDIPGLDECFGISAHHCPYCDGWEVRDRDLVVIGRRNKGAGLALALTTWSPRVVVCSHGPAGIRPPQHEQLTAHGIQVDERRIARVDHVDGFLRELVLADGGRRTCDAVFIAGEHRQRCNLPRQLGCALTRHGLVKTDHLGQTGVPGLYVAGDASRDVQFVVVAAAEGAKAGVAINKALQARAGLVIDAAG